MIQNNNHVMIRVKLAIDGGGYLNLSSGEQPKSALHTGQCFSCSSISFLSMHPLQTVIQQTQTQLTLHAAWNILTVTQPKMHQKISGDRYIHFPQN